MVRSELVARIAKQSPHLSTQDVEAAVALILETMTDALARGDRVELRGFGMFEPKWREARVRRNPSNQAVVEVPATITIGFRPGQAMRDRLNPQAQVQEREAESLERAS